MNRINRVEERHLLSQNEDLSYTYIVVYGIFFLWFPLVQIQSPRFEMRSNSPLVANGYPLSGGNGIIRSKRVMLLFLKERTNRVSYLANFHN